MITPSKLMKANVWRFSFPQIWAVFLGKDEVTFQPEGTPAAFNTTIHIDCVNSVAGNVQIEIYCANVQIEPFLTIYFTLRSQKIKKWCLFEDIFPSRVGGSGKKIYVQIGIAQISKRLTHPQLNSHFGPLLNKSVNITMEGPNVNPI